MNNQKLKSGLNKLKFDLKKDQLPFGEIDVRVKNGIHLSGSPLIILIFSSLIGSIGLNIDSTPMVLGAKLIAPLMVMMLGMGYGIATYNYFIAKKALKYFSIQFLIIIVTSTIYFTISPIKTPTNELYTKTIVTVFDVLVALFAGSAAVIANTRFERYNILPGVAIATSLVPPVCTVGYGIANHNINYIIAPLYLFAVNMVFITFSMFLVFRIISRKEIEAPKQFNSRSKQAIYIIATLLIAIPVFSPTFSTIRDNYFNSLDKSHAHQYIESQLNFENSTILDSKLDTKNKTITLLIIGDEITKEQQQAMSDALKIHDLGDYSLVLIQGTENVLIDFFKDKNASKFK